MRKLSCLCFLLILISGCALNASITRGKLARLTLNMSTEQVRQIMGYPFSTETYLSSDNKTNLIWNYRTAYSTDMTGIIHQETTPLVFEDNLLVGWGSNFYDKLVAPDMQKQDIRVKIKQE